jgi:FkbM family methyltransferase
MIRSAITAAGSAVAKLIQLRDNGRDLYYAYSPTVRHTERMTPYGFSMIAGNSMHHRLMQDGTFEPDEVALTAEYLEVSDVFVDIGANIGFYSCLARSLGKHAVVIEPQQQNLRYVYANLSANGWTDVEVFPLGLSGQAGVETLYGVSSTGASLIPGWAAQPKGFKKTIPVSTLDILLGSRFQGRKMFIKLDVEGFEYQVLLGCGEVLAIQPKPTWMVEICLSDYHPGGSNAHYRDTFAIFFDAGYQARAANGNRTVISLADIERRVKDGRSDSGTINYLMVPVESS